MFHCTLPSDSAFDRALTTWSLRSGTGAPLGMAAGRQVSWDGPVVQREFDGLLDSAADVSDRARLLAVSSKRSGDWLHALPISACGLLLEDEAVRVAVGFRLGAKLCEPHPCPCGADVDARGAHSLSCRRSSGRILRHNALNDLIRRALARADVPSTLEPAGLTRVDGKRPDGLTLVPWKGGRSAVWDVTVTDTLAPSYVHATTLTSGAAAESAAARKQSKYEALTSAYIVIPIAFETLGPINELGASFINEIGSRTSRKLGDNRETAFLWQRLSVAIQRFNAICFASTFYDMNLECLNMDA